MVAYSPASRTAEMVRSTKRATPSLGAARVHRHPFRARHVVRKDDGRAAVGLVLLDDEWVLDLLAELGLELDHPARQERVQLRLEQRLAHRLAVGAAGLLDGREEDARALVSERLEPLRRAPAVARPEGVDEALRLRVLRGELRAPPHAGEDAAHVVRAQRLHRVLLGAARAVADHLVAHAARDVLTVHGDVIGQVGVDEEEVDAGRLHLPQQRAEVLAVQLERIVDGDLVPAAALLREVGDAPAEVLAVGGVLPDERDLGGLRELARLLLLIDPRMSVVPSSSTGEIRPKRYLYLRL